MYWAWITIVATDGSAPICHRDICDHNDFLYFHDSYGTCMIRVIVAPGEVLLINKHAVYGC